MEKQKFVKLMNKIKASWEAFESHRSKFDYMINPDFYDPFHVLLDAWETAFAEACDINPEAMSWFTTENDFGNKKLTGAWPSKKKPETAITDAGVFWDFEMVDDK